MTTALITTCALLLTLAALAYAAWHRYYKRRAERVYSWQEWKHARQWDRYNWNPQVDARPMDKKE